MDLGLFHILLHLLYPLVADRVRDPVWLFAVAVGQLVVDLMVAQLVVNLVLKSALVRVEEYIDFYYYYNADEVYEENKEFFHNKYKCDSFYHYVP